MTQVKEYIITNETICQIFCGIPTIQNQVDKRQLNLIGKVTRNSDKQLPTKLLTVWCNNKWQVGGVRHPKNKTLVQNIALIVPTLYQYVSLKLRAHLASLDNRDFKYSINVIVNAPTPPPVPPPSPNTEIAHPPSSPSTPRPSQYPLTSSPPSQRKIFSPIPSPWEAPTSLRSRTPRYDRYGVLKTGIYSMGILLITRRVQDIGNNIPS